MHKSSSKKYIIGIVGAVIILGLLVWYMLSGKSPFLQQSEEVASTTPTVQETDTDIVSNTQKPLRLLAPNGGEVWVRNKQYNVRWVANLASTTDVTPVLFPTKKIISDPYSASLGSISGVNMIVSAFFAEGTNEGSFSYHVPDTLTPGTYQVLLLGGNKCNLADKTHRCVYDLSDGLITVR